MSNERIIEKLKKLLAMANSKANENEAMTAARQLHFLLAKHNLDISDISDQTPEEFKELSIQIVSRPWKRILTFKVAELYFCSYFSRPRPKVRTEVFVFIGTESNRTFAAYIFEMIIKTVEREARAQSKAIYGKKNHSFVSSFWLGAQGRICLRIDKIIKDAEAGVCQDPEGNTLPAIASFYKNNRIDLERYISTKYDLKFKKVKRTIRNHEGLLRGRELGDKVQINRLLHSESNRIGGNK